MNEFSDEEKILRAYEEKKDYVGALKHALHIKMKTHKVDLKIGKYYRILGLPEKALDTYISTLLAHPENHDYTCRQLDACLRHIYQKQLNKQEFKVIGNTTIFPKTTNKPRSRMLRGSVLILCDGNIAFKEFLLKTVSGRYKIPSLLKRFTFSNISSADLLNLSRFVKHLKGTSIKSLHFRGNLCSHVASLLLKGFDVEEVIFENVKLSDSSGVLEFKVKRFIIVGQMDDLSLSCIQAHVLDAYVSPTSLTSSPKILIATSCSTLQGATSQKVELMQLKNLRSLRIKRALEEKDFPMGQLSGLYYIERLSLSGYSLQGGCHLPCIHHLELDNFSGLSTLLNMLTMNKRFRSIVLKESAEPLRKDVAEWICDMHYLEELIVINCEVDIFFLEHISSQFFNVPRKCLGIVDCGADALVCSLQERHPTNIVFHDYPTFELLRARTWPETQVEFYYKE